MHNLPLHTITPVILRYLDKASPNYSEELDAAIKYGGLNPVIIYNNAKQPIRDIAEITEEHQIIINENYIAFLWCLSFAIITFYNERDNGIITFNKNRKLQEAFAIMDYGYSLKEEWSYWPEDLPNPTNIENRYVDEANAITIFAMNYIIAHEIGHHELGHNLADVELNIEEAQEDEFSADKYAFDVLIGGYVQGYEAKKHSINLSIIVGLGSILLLENSWKAEVLHPDTDARFTKILQNIQDANGDIDEYWTWGLTILYLWNVRYENQIAYFSGDGSAKATYLEFVEHLRSKQ